MIVSDIPVIEGILPAIDRPYTSTFFLLSSPAIPLNPSMASGKTPTFLVDSQGDVDPGAKIPQVPGDTMEVLIGAS